MKKVIMINFCNGLYGGIESFLLNAFYRIDKEEFEVTFLTCGKSTYDMFREDIERKGGHVDEIPILTENIKESVKNKVKLYHQLRQYFRDKTPDVVHINSGTLSLNYLASYAAKRENVNNIIVHSHNFRPQISKGRDIIRGFLKRKMEKCATAYLACSEGAANWTFSKNKVINGEVIIIPNGVDTSRFAFDVEKRNNFRESLGLGKELLLGNIGRFQEQKNHEFMIKIMQKLVKILPDAKLLLVGEGEKKEKIIKLVNETNLTNNVIFLGERKDMEAFLSAIDIFILPSLYEGLPIASVEAQASGAKVIISDKITREANITDEVVYLAIDSDGAENIWVNQIKNYEPTTDRIKNNKIIKEKGFDICTCYECLFDVYRKR